MNTAFQSRTGLFALAISNMPRLPEALTNVSKSPLLKDSAVSAHDASLKHAPVPLKKMTSFVEF